MGKGKEGALGGVQIFVSHKDTKSHERFTTLCVFVRNKKLHIDEHKKITLLLLLKLYCIHQSTFSGFRTARPRIHETPF